MHAILLEQTLLLLLPKFDERILRWKPRIIAELVDDAPRVATKLVQLRQILPTADVYEIVLKRCVHLVLEKVCVSVWAPPGGIVCVWVGGKSGQCSLVLVWGMLSLNLMVTVKILRCRPMLLGDTEFQRIPAAIEYLKEKKFAQADICMIVEKQPLWVVEDLDHVFERLGTCAQPLCMNCLNGTLFVHACMYAISLLNHRRFWLI